MKNIQLKIIFIALVFFSTFWLVGISLGANEKSNGTDTRIVKTNSIDLDYNKISDNLDKKIATKTYRHDVKDPKKVDIIISFDHAPTPSDQKIIEDLEGNVYETWDGLVYAFHASLPYNKLNKYSKENLGIVLIEENSESKATLEFSTRQIRTRQIIWDNSRGIFPRGYTGNASHSIAVLDTGVDDSHPDLAGRVVAWQDFIGENDDGSLADIYSTPTDRGQHGTHVSGIALGNGGAGGVKNAPGKINITYAGVFPQTEGDGWTNYYPINTSGGADVIGATLNWQVNAPGDWYYVWFKNITGVSINIVNGANRPLVASSNSIGAGITGNYQVIYATNSSDGVNTNDTIYWGQIQTPMNNIGDNRNLLTGVAPTSNLVGLKVLDDNGGGDQASLLNALTWVDNNKTTYPLQKEWF